MILGRLEKTGWNIVCESLGFSPVRDAELANCRLILEFKNRRPGIRNNKWTIYRLYFSPNEIKSLRLILAGLGEVEPEEDPLASLTTALEEIEKL